MFKNMNDERKASFAILLSILVVITWTNLFLAPDPIVVQQKQEVIEDNQQKLAKAKDPVENVAAGQSAPTEIVAAKEITQPDLIPADFNAAEITVLTPLAEYKINPLGANLSSLKLNKHFATSDQKYKLEMLGIESAEQAKILTVTTGEGLSDHDVAYGLAGASEACQQESGGYELAASGNCALKFVGKLANGNQITKILTFNPENYMFSVGIKLAQPTVDGSKIKLNWTKDLPLDYVENRYNQKSYVYLSAEDKITREYISKDQQVFPTKSARWVGIGDNYFGTYLLSDNPASPVDFGTEMTKGGSLLSLAMTAADSQQAEFKIYSGPKIPDDLLAAGYALNKSIDLGWFAFIGQPILKFIQFCYNLLGNYGLAIILVTILMKLLLLPLTKSSYKSMARMQEMQPKVKALREREKDPKIVQQEMLKIYQENGVNPMGGCLPMVLQIPVFLGMYNALQSSVYLRHADFALWINDLSTPEALTIFGVPVPVMILLMGASMFVQTAFTPNPAADANQRKIMYLMPVMFTLMFIIYPFPSGLVLYWLVNNVMTIMQQYAMRTKRNIEPFSVTIVAGIAVFAFSFILTKL